MGKPDPLVEWEPDGLVLSLDEAMNADVNVAKALDMISVMEAQIVAMMLAVE